MFCVWGTATLEISHPQFLRGGHTSVSGCLWLASSPGLPLPSQWTFLNRAASGLSLDHGPHLVLRANKLKRQTVPSAATSLQSSIGEMSHSFLHLGFSIHGPDAHLASPQSLWDPGQLSETFPRSPLDLPLFIPLRWRLSQLDCESCTGCLVSSFGIWECFPPFVLFLEFVIPVKMKTQGVPFKKPISFIIQDNLGFFVSLSLFIGHFQKVIQPKWPGKVFDIIVLFICKEFGSVHFHFISLHFFNSVPNNPVFSAVSHFCAASNIDFAYILWFPTFSIWPRAHVM